MISELRAATGRDVSRETAELLNAYVSLLIEESQRQNLISAATRNNIFRRHILDSAQLVRFEPNPASAWLDIGSGAGLPGIVVALLVDGPVTLLEPRRLRAEFLTRVVGDLGLSDRCRVAHAKVERLEETFDVITARAVAPLARLFEISHHLSTEKSRWVLPKGRSAQSELAEALRSWQGLFHVERSITDEESFIIVGDGVKRKDKARGGR